MTPNEFEAELRRLMRAGPDERSDGTCIACTDCERCSESTFCVRSKGLLRCHYCVDAERCVQSTHCRSSKDLFACNHCEHSERCVQSSYLVKCFDCTSCTYLFGCVGLVGKDFHVLNRPYPRGEYFALTNRLKKALGV